MVLSYFGTSGYIPKLLGTLANAGTSLIGTLAYAHIKSEHRLLGTRANAGAYQSFLSQAGVS